MKNARLLCATLPAFVAIMSVGRADTAAPVANPYLQTDSEGVPLVVTHPELASLTPEQKEAIQKEQDKQDADKDWLMRIYTAKMQQRAAAHPSSDGEQPLFYQLSANKDLAHLAGLHEDGPADDKSDKGSSSTDAAAAPGAPGNAAGLKSNASNNLAHGYQYKSLVAPTSALSMYGLHNYYGSFNADAAPKVTVPKKDESTDLTDIQTPGMLAAKDGAKEPDLGSPDLTLDLLPGESMEQARMEKQNAKSLALPDPMNSDPLRVAGLTTSNNSTNSATKPAIPTAKIAQDPRDDPDAPVPVVNMPVISPVHPPMADPADLLER